jgi:high frequency lysogenization protein
MPPDTDPIDYRALALAGVVQAAAMVHRVAHGQALPEGPHQALLRTIPTHKAAGLQEIFPDPGAFQPGATAAIEALSARSHTPEILRYSLQVVELARMLSNVPQVREKLAQLIDAIDPERPDEQQLAQIYQQTVSTLGKRIQVTGDPQTLQQESVAERVRALLLAGVRLGWLWQQLGGRRWHLVLRRGALLVALRPLTNVSGQGSQEGSQE